MYKKPFDHQVINPKILMSCQGHKIDNTFLAKEKHVDKINFKVRLKFLMNINITRLKFIP